MVRSMRKRLLTTPLFAVEQREYTPDDGGGEPAVRQVVVHPGAVVILLLLDDRRVVMIRDYRYTVEQELLELPAGTREPNETPIDTARRELEEETGYRAGQIEPLASFYTSPDIMTEMMHAFVATDLVEVGRNLDPSERITTQIVDLVDARRMLAEDMLDDAKTIATLAVYLTRVRG